MSSDRKGLFDPLHDAEQPKPKPSTGVPPINRYNEKGSETERQSSPQPSQSQPATRISFTTSYSLGGIGIFVDRWTSLFPGMGDKTGEVQASILTELKTRKVPVTSLGAVKAYPGLLSQYTSIVRGGERPYIIATTDPGVTCAVYVDQYGSDLYTSWRTHIAGIINIKLLATLGLIALVPAIIVLLGSIVIQNLTQQAVNVFGQTSGSSFNLLPTLAIMVIVFLFFLVSELTFLALVGYFLKDGFLYYFFIEPTIFSAEDITALSSAVHQCIINAVDKAGIPTKQVEPKKFNSGRRAEKL